MDYPITLEALLSIAGVAAVSGVLAQWLKQYLMDWRYTNLLVLVVALALSVLARSVLAGWAPSAREVYEAVLVGFFGASVATLGYETLANVAGTLGRGDRR